VKERGEWRVKREAGNVKRSLSLKKNQPFSKKILKMADFYLLVQYNFVFLYYQIRW